jgi:hypothetical protein
MLKWEKSKTETYFDKITGEQLNEGDLYFADINGTSFYRILKSKFTAWFELAELTENKPYYSTGQLGKFATLEEAQQRAEKRELNKLTRKESTYLKALEFAKSEIDKLTSSKKLPLHQGNCDVTEVLNFRDIAETYGLSTRQYEQLIDRAQSYVNKWIKDTYWGKS